jgi:ribosomal protein L37AE/L43A
VAVLEYANKRNMKSMARWLLGRQDWSPIAKEPVEFVKLNYDFHPAWMADQFSNAGLKVRQQLAVSHFRTPLLKRNVAAATLAKVDSWIFSPGGYYPLAPSVFVQLEAEKVGEESHLVKKQENKESNKNEIADLSDLFRCPTCGGDRTLRLEHEAQFICQQCSKQYAKRDGIWDFKESLD